MEFPPNREKNFPVPFSLPLSTTGTPGLRPEDVCWGVEHGWLSHEDAIKFALGVYEKEASLRPLALAYDEPERAPWILEELGKVAPPDSRSEAAWLYIALNWIREHESEIGPEWPLLRDAVIAEFGYPEIVRPLLSFSIPDKDSHPYADETFRNILSQLEPFASGANSQTLEKLF